MVRRTSQTRSELLYDSFLVVRPVRGPDGSFAPKIALQYPAAGQPGTAALPRDVELFCYPDAEQTRPVASSDAAAGRAEEFTFVLTAEDGGRIFGFCRRSLPAGVGRRFDGGKRLPETLCFVGRRPYFGLFSTLLGVACARRWLDPPSLPSLLHAAREHSPFPMPGEVFALREGGVARDRQLRLLRPNDGEVDGLDHADMRQLLLRLPPSQLILLISALLLERRVVVSSASLHVLSAGIHAAVALLAPFTWEHIFVPVLPRALLSYACAPMPFVVGVRAELMDELRELPLSGIVFVDLDAGTLHTTEDGHEDDVVLPMCGTGGAAEVAESTGYLDGGHHEGGSGGGGGGGSEKKGGLRGLLGKVQEKVQNSVVELGLGSATAGQLLCRDIITVSERTRGDGGYLPNKELQTAFVAFFLHIFGDHTSYCVAPPGSAELRFDRELFLRRRSQMDSGDPALGRFLSLFHGSQMFEVFGEAQIKRLREQSSSGMGGGGGGAHKLGGGGLFARAAVTLVGSGGSSKDFSVGTVRKVLRRMQANEMADASQPVRDLVLALTSNTPLKEVPGRGQWDVVVQLAEQLADARHFNAALALINARISDSSGWQWRHGVKACELLGTLLSMPGAPEGLLPAALDAAPEMRRLMARESELAGKVPGFPADAPARVRRAAHCVHVLSHDWARLQRARRFCGRLEPPPYGLPSGRGSLGKKLRSLPLHADTAKETATARRQAEAEAAAAGSAVRGRTGESVHGHRRRMRCFACSFSALHSRLRPPEVASATTVPEQLQPPPRKAREAPEPAAQQSAQLVDVFGGFGFGSAGGSAGGSVGGSVGGGGGAGGAQAEQPDWATLPDGVASPGASVDTAQGQGAWSAFDFDNAQVPSAADDGFGDAFSAPTGSSPGGTAVSDGFGDAFSPAQAGGTSAASDGFGDSFSAASAPSSTATTAAPASDGFGDAFSVPAASSPGPAGAAVSDGFGDAFSVPQHSAAANAAADDGFGSLAAPTAAPLLAAPPAAPAPQQPAQTDMWAGLDLLSPAVPVAATSTRATQQPAAMMSGAADPFAQLAQGQQAAYGMGTAQQPMNAVQQQQQRQQQQPVMMQSHGAQQQQQQQQQQHHHHHHQGQQNSNANSKDPFAALGGF